MNRSFIGLNTEFLYSLYTPNIFTKTNNINNRPTRTMSALCTTMRWIILNLKHEIATTILHCRSHAINPSVKHLNNIYDYYIVLLLLVDSVKVKTLLTIRHAVYVYVYI